MNWSFKICKFDRNLNPSKKFSFKKIMWYRRQNVASSHRHRWRDTDHDTHLVNNHHSLTMEFIANNNWVHSNNLRHAIWHAKLCGFIMTRISILAACCAVSVIPQQTNRRLQETNLNNDESMTSTHLRCTTGERRTDLEWMIHKMESKELHLNISKCREVSRGCVDHFEGRHLVLFPLKRFRSNFKFA